MLLDLQYFVSVGDVVVVDVNVERLFIVKAEVVVFHRFVHHSLFRLHADKIYLSMIPEHVLKTLESL